MKGVAQSDEPAEDLPAQHQLDRQTSLWLDGNLVEHLAAKELGNMHVCILDWILENIFITETLHQVNDYLSV